MLKEKGLRYTNKYLKDLSDEELDKVILMNVISSSAIENIDVKYLLKE